MTRRDALVEVIEALHDEIDALKKNDVSGLQHATSRKLAGIDVLARFDRDPPNPEVRELAAEANRLNETCRIYVNLMAANVRRRLQVLTGTGMPAYLPGRSSFA